jgi:hypothetical protein
LVPFPQRKFMPQHPVVSTHILCSNGQMKVIVV